MASLDHAMWFHRPFRADEWLLYDQWTPSTSDARGLAMGHIFTAGRPARGDRGAGGPHPRSCPLTGRDLPAGPSAGLLDGSPPARAGRTDGAVRADPAAASAAESTADRPVRGQRTTRARQPRSASRPGDDRQPWHHRRRDHDRASSHRPEPRCRPRLALTEIGTFDEPVALVDRQGTLYVAEKGRAGPGADAAASRVEVLDMTDLTELRRRAGPARPGLLAGRQPCSTSATRTPMATPGSTSTPWDGPDGTADPASRREMLALDQPYGNHNGGHVVVRPRRPAVPGLRRRRLGR